MKPKAIAAVEGIGLSGQQHGATLLDSQGKVLRPCILWNDARSFRECEEIMAREPKAVPPFTAIYRSRAIPRPSSCG
jgi:xylulokinase